MVFNSIKLFFLIKKKFNYLYLRLLVKNTQYSFVCFVCMCFFLQININIVIIKKNNNKF